MSRSFMRNILKKNDFAPLRIKRKPAKAVGAEEYRRVLESTAVHYHAGKKVQELESLTKPLVEWLNENYYPYGTVIVNKDGVQLLDVEIGIPAQKTL